MTDAQGFLAIIWCRYLLRDYVVGFKAGICEVRLAGTVYYWPEHTVTVQRTEATSAILTFRSEIPITCLTTLVLIFYLLLILLLTSFTFELDSCW